MRADSGIASKQLGEDSAHDSINESQSPVAGRQSPGLTDLAGTAKAFNSRIQKKKQQIADSGSAEEKATKQRHQLMLHALMDIRRSLVDITRIDLGEFFTLELDADDFHGWPRLTVRLVDHREILAVFPTFEVVAHDRQARGAIEITSGSPKRTVSMGMGRESDLQRLPVILKSSVRSFLDLIEDVVLERESYHQQHSFDTLSLPSFSASSPEQIPKDSLQVDLYEEKFSREDIFEGVGGRDEIQPLPD